MTPDFKVKPIGVIHSPFHDPGETPIQPALAEGGKGAVEVFEQYADGLKDIEGFSHVILVYWFDRAGEVELVRKPFLGDESYGLFSMRYPCRPNPIGISTVRLTGLRGNVLDVEGIDVLDGTPLLDIKPHVPEFTAGGPVRIGWLEKHLRPREE